MSWHIDRDALRAALHRIHGAGGDLLASNPIFQYVKLTAKPDSIRLVCGNSIVTATTATEAQVGGTGEVCVPLKSFKDAVDLVPSGKIDLLLESTTRLRMKSGDRTVTFAGRPAGEYPRTPRAPQGHARIPAESLRSVLTRTVHAASRSRDNPAATLIHISWDEARLTAFAMDGSRAAEAHVNFEGKAQAKMVLDRVAAVEILRLLDQERTEALEVSQTESHAFVRAGSTRLTIAKLDRGECERPDELRASTVRRACVARQDFLDALRASKKLTHDERVWLLLRDADIVVSSDPQISDVSFVAAVPASVTGDAIKVCVNGEHVA